MVFSSLTFLFVFLPVTLFLYFLFPRKFKNLILLLMSLIFYAWGEPVYILLMIFSSVVDYTHGMLIHKYWDNKKLKKTFLLSSIIINIGLLSFFKYSDFIIFNINNIFDTSFKLLNLPLPIGISFYTFQTMSYTIDVYRGEAPVQKNFISLAAYVTLFPQLIAGPIVRYQTIADQLNDRKETLDQIGTGIRRFIIGLGKKVLLANNIGYLWSEISTSTLTDIPVITAWLGIIAFGLQIYFDFSGYSDMAIGLGKIFGFDFCENFNYPYISKSISEFWRRWHMSLGTWFKDYVYIPLGGNRSGTFKTIRNLIIVWFLTGLWHGASWNFVLWGIYFGFFIALERFLLKDILQTISPLLSHIYVLLILVIGWVLFYFEDMSQVVIYIKSMFALNNNSFMDNESVYYFFNNIIILIISILAATPIFKKLHDYLMKRSKLNTLYENVVVNFNCFLVMFLSTAYLVDASYNPFLYFRF
ncbi:MBOAT family O-acyltransferase [Oceanirhabdus seepicola]|uniref:MBOAT family protein n=1 Tax=Oceanirhabdus seepicola TaxID=2828781 RepID=A0A9J6P0U4_9CLOT|nr:MBOAT family O-acyltransferase [Oceanirhabdus seepicola]MCM1989814.1 MBOAT family protein [Oceanirhabdus seepicola]